MIRANCFVFFAKLFLFIVPWALFVSVFLSSSQASQALSARQFLLPDQGCTVFYGADENAVLGGNNEDFLNPLTFVWFHPAENGRFGWVAFGFDDLTPQGMINDQGLFFDGLALPYKAFRDSGKPAPPDGILSLIEDVFATSSTVEQVQERLGRYTLNGLQTGQLFFGDRFGHSLIIDGDTVLPISGKFQVAANFRQVEYPEPPYPSDLYNKATAMLSQAETYSVDLFRDTLEAVHQEGITPTQYSQVYDLKYGLIYLYLFHDFEQVVVINIAEELAKGPHSASLVSLFPRNDAREEFAFQPLLQYQVDVDSRAVKNYDSSQLEAFTGEYLDSAGSGEQTTRVFIDSGNLFFQKEGLPAFQLYPLGDDAFVHPYFYRGTETSVKFQRNLFGQVTGLEGVFAAAEFGIRQPFRLEKMPTSTAQPSWIALGLGAAGLAGAGIYLWAKKRRSA